MHRSQVILLRGTEVVMPSQVYCGGRVEMLLYRTNVLIGWHRSRNLLSSLVHLKHLSSSLADLRF